MRGDDLKTEAMFCYLSPETVVPEGHPLRPIRKMVDQALAELSPVFEKMHSVLIPAVLRYRRKNC